MGIGGGIKAKICGITNLEDALTSIAAGCDALGFAFFKKSPRYIAPEKASQIIKKLPKHIMKIGVFVNAREKVIKRIARICKLDMLQFHGNESPEFCAKFKHYKIIKVFRIKSKIDFKKINQYKPFAYLFDTYVPGKPGGTGKKFNWQLIRHLDTVKYPIFLSGGLSVRNVKRAVEIACPAWVDVCSSVEIRPGKKDAKKVKAFIKAVKGK